MTDNEIINGWEKVLATGDAPIGEHWGCSITTRFAKDTFDMLTRQKADIERYEKTVGKLGVHEDGTVTGLLNGKETRFIAKDVADMFKRWAVESAKSEAYEEFAERFVEEYSLRIGEDEEVDEIIDNLLTELVGRKEYK